ncbi:hypothetical protein HNR16_002747 [Pseudoclavibacter chungangensis]|uniref:hypothetical protein n=1 Tax=Pseudoclavibacter chungangensis TaxID=587635 RepID=UPI0015C90D9B|nr:hypothetical protein [Pseudoclavibacter chungangensis]NYJ67959.1 hypothetical protein [Pseudoclavibacter chungangensis]
MLADASPLLPDDLRAELDAIPHAARMRRVALLGRDLASRTELAALLDDLERASPAHRRLVVEAARASGDGARLRRLADDGNERVRRAAFEALPLDDDPSPRVLAAGVLERARILRRVARARDDGARARAERVFAAVRATLGAQSGIVLLPACAPDTVAATVDEIVVTPELLGRFAAAHPGFVARQIDADLASGMRGWAPFVDALGALALSAPLAVLDLVERRADGRLPWELDASLGVLAHADPERTTRLLERPAAWHGRRHVPGPLRRARGPLDDGRRARIAVGIAFGAPHLLGAWLHTMASGRRASTLDAVLESGALLTPEWVGDVLDALPPRARHERAHRQRSAFGAFAGGVPVQITARLPWSEARATLDPRTRSSDADERAQAWWGLATAAVLETAAHAEATTVAAHPGGVVTPLDEVLDGTGRTARERDLVRARLLDALVAVPASMWTPARIGTLVSIAEHAAAALDTGAGVRCDLVRILARVAADTTAWDGRPGPAAERDARSTVETGDRHAAATAATAALGRVVELLGAPSVHEAAAWAPAAADRAVWTALEPAASAGTRDGTPELTIDYARALGPRASALDTLQAALASIALDGDAGPARRAIPLWLADPATRRERLRRLLAADPSSFVLPAVAALVGRTQWGLDESLAHLGRPGRFVRTDRSAPVVRPARPERWLPRQCRVFADHLIATIRELPDANADPRAAALALAALPAVGGPALAGLCLERTAPAVRARLALARSRADDPVTALPELLDACVADAPSPAAVLDRCARAVPRAVAGAAFDVASPAWTGPVRVRRAAVRLLAATKPPGWSVLLAHAARSSETHPDVRIEAARALSGALDTAAAVGALRALADTVVGAGDPVARVDAARGIATIRPDGVAPAHRTLLAEIIDGLVERGDDLVRDEVGARLAPWVAVAPAAARAAAALVVRLDDTGERWRSAAHALAAAAAVPHVQSVLLDLTTVLVDGARAEDGVDRPAADRLRDVVDALVGGGVASASLALTGRLADLVATVQPHTAATLRLAVVQLAPDDAAGLDGLVRDLTPLPLVAAAVANRLSPGGRHPWSPGPIPGAGRIARRIVESHGPTPVACVFALALLAAEFTVSAPEDVELVRRLRDHPDPSIAEFARGVRVAAHGGRGVTTVVGTWF